MHGLALAKLEDSISEALRSHSCGCVIQLRSFLRDALTLNPGPRIVSDHIISITPCWHPLKKPIFNAFRRFTIGLIRAVGEGHPKRPSENLAEDPPRVACADSVTVELEYNGITQTTGAFATVSLPRRENLALLEVRLPRWDGEGPRGLNDTTSSSSMLD